MTIDELRKHASYDTEFDMLHIRGMRAVIGSGIADGDVVPITAPGGRYGEPLAYVSEHTYGLLVQSAKTA